MSSTIEEQPWGQEKGALEEHVAKIEIARNAMFEQASQFVKRPSPKKRKAVTKQLSSASDIFHDAVEYIFDDPDYNNDQRAAIVTSLLHTDDKERLSFFQILAPGHKFDPLKRSWEEHAADLARELKWASGELEYDEDEDEPSFDTSEDAMFHVCVMQEENAMQDFFELESYCSSKWRARTIELGRAAMQRGTRVAEIAAGVALGVTVERLFH
jgi:hypothetical protein